MPAMVIPLEDGVRPQCLDDWETYSRLQGQLIFVKKFWYLAVAVPLVLLGGFSTRFFPKSQTAQSVAFGITFIWVFAVLAYSLGVSLRYFLIRCPNCGWRFGPGISCGSCGLPRTRNASA